MFIKTEIQNRLDEFYTICVNHKVKRLYAFGSSVSGRFDVDSSDIDLIVDISDPNPITKGELLYSFWDAMEYFFNRKIDLLTEASIKNPYLKQSIDKTKVLIYDREAAQVFV